MLARIGVRREGGDTERVGGCPRRTRASRRASRAFFDRFLAPRAEGGGRYLWARWLFLRGLGLIFGSAFLSLAFQIHGLIGPRGILPAGEYLGVVRRRCRRCWRSGTRRPCCGSPPPTRR